MNNMKGKYNIEIHNGSVVWKLAVCRNLTVIRGNSGTGKQVMIESVDSYCRDKERGIRQAIQISCSVPCVTIQDIQKEFSNITVTNSIVFIDEFDTKVVNTEEFARYIKECSNYFVIVQRDRLGRLRNKPWISIDTGVLHNCTDSEIKQTLNTFISDINI